MIDFSMFEKALKITWVKRLCSEHNSPWRHIPLSLLSSVGGNFLFKCNHDINSLCLSHHVPTFYGKVIFCWQELNSETPKEKREIINQIIWNNRFIKIHNASVFFRTWSQIGIQTLADLVNREKKGLISFKDFLKKFNIKCNFFQYYSLISAIPSH